MLWVPLSLEMPHQGSSNDHHQHRFLRRNKQNYPLIIIKYHQIHTLSILLHCQSVEPNKGKNYLPTTSMHFPCSYDMHRCHIKVFQ